MPVNSTTVGTCSIIFKVNILESSVITVTVSTVLQVYSSTTATIFISFVECSNIVNEYTIIYSTVNTCPDDCTTVTDVAMFIHNCTFSSVVGEVGIMDFTMVTTPEYCTTIGHSYVIGECGVVYVTVMSTFVPV